MAKIPTSLLCRKLNPNSISLKSIQNFSVLIEPNDKRPSALDTLKPTKGVENQVLQQQQLEQTDFTNVVEDVCRFIRTQPRWESSLLSRFPSVSLFKPNFVSQVLKRQNNVIISVRFFYWLNENPGFSPDSVSCKLLFDALVESKAANLARSFLDQFKFVPEPSSLEALIQCFCKNGSIEEALDFISKSKSLGVYPSIATCNLVLSGSIRCRRTDFAWKLYKEMLEIGIAPDVQTVGYLIQACCIDGEVERGYEFLWQVLDDYGVAPNNIAFNRLIFGFCKGRNYGRVSELLHVMIAKNCKPDIFTYQEVIYGLCKGRKGIEGYRIFNNLKDRGYHPDRVMYTTMINGLCKVKWLGEARKLWFEMIQKGLVPNEYTYNVLIHGFCVIGDLDEAWKLREEMLNQGYKETTMSSNVWISGLCKNGKVKEASDMFEDMTSKGVFRDLITYNTLIGGLCKEGNVMKGQELFEDLVSQGLQPSTSTYSPLLEQFCEIGSMQKAIALWTDMENRGVKPSVYSYECIISGFSEQGSGVEGMQWLSEMLNKKLKPHRRTFEGLIKCLSQKHEFEDALLVLGSMLHIGYKLSEKVCCLLVSKLCAESSYHAETCLGNILESS